MQGNLTSENKRPSRKMNSRREIVAKQEGIQGTESCNTVYNLTSENTRPNREARSKNNVAKKEGKQDLKALMQDNVSS